MATLSLNGISKIFAHKVEAVKNVSLDVRDGEFVVLVGPSGCGKSTLLNMIAGLEDISRGSLTINGRQVNELPAKSRDIAMVFQNYALYPHMTVFDNMAFGLKLRKVPKPEIERRVREAAEVLSIQQLLDRFPRELSGGQRQRVAVGRAIVRKPAIFLFDEPLSNLDAKLRVQMRVELKDLHHRLGATMIYVTHDQTEAMTMGDRIVVMRDGLIQQVASPLEVYEHPCNKFVASFIGTPPMNFFPGHIVREDEEFHFVQDKGISVRLPLRLEGPAKDYVGKSVYLGIRPEGIGSLMATLQRDPATIKGRIRVIEPMGSENYLYIDTGAGSFVARVEKSGYTIGQDVSLPIMHEKMHLFDGETELNLEEQRTTRKDKFNESSHSPRPLANQGSR